MFKRIDIATGKILGLVARNCAFLSEDSHFLEGSCFFHPIVLPEIKHI